MKKKTPKRVNYTQIGDLSLWTHGGVPSNVPTGMPSEIRVYGQKYQVHYHSRIYAAKKRNQRLRGVVMYGPRMIYLDPEQTIHEMREVLYHEVGHIYVKVWQSKSEALSRATYQQVEDFCDLVGEAIPDLVGNNSITV